MTTLWVPISALTELRLVHPVAENARLESVRDGFRRWLWSDGGPLPPIVVGIGASCTCRVDRDGHHTCGTLQDGHHRLTIAREMGLPLRVTYVFAGATHGRFGWPADKSPAELQGQTLESEFGTLSQPAAQGFRGEILGCIAFRQNSTGHDFDSVARDMFARHAELSPLAEINALNWALGRRGYWIERARHVAALARASSDATWTEADTASIKVARDVLVNLVHALEGER